MANTCVVRASTGDGDRDCRDLDDDGDRDCKGAVVVVDTTIPESGASFGAGGGSGSGALTASHETAIAVVVRALAVSLVAPVSEGDAGVEEAGEPAVGGAEGGAAGASPGRLALVTAGPLDADPALDEQLLELEELAALGLQPRSLVANGADTVIPEPGAALLFATGVAQLAIRRRHRPR
jgi:hypothetical protein